MFEEVKKVFFYVEKVLTGTIGDGVSYKEQKKRTQKGKDLEEAIERIATQEGYKVVRNMYIPYGNEGKTTEIDLALIGSRGLIIVEAKNYTGSITGSVQEQIWDVVYPSGKEYTLYNPVRQNNSHISTLQKHINQDMYSIVVFSDKATLNIRGVGNTAIINLRDLSSTLRAANDNLSKGTVKKIHKKLCSFVTYNPITKINHKRDVVKKRKRPGDRRL